MLIIQIDFACNLCGKSDAGFYIMPLDIKVNEKDTRPSLQDYVLRCKNCKQRYLLQYTIKSI